MMRISSKTQKILLFFQQMPALNVLLDHVQLANDLVKEAIEKRQEYKYFYLFFKKQPSIFFFFFHVDKTVLREILQEKIIKDNEITKNIICVKTLTGLFFFFFEKR